MRIPVLSAQIPALFADERRDQDEDNPRLDQDEKCHNTVERAKGQSDKV